MLDRTVVSLPKGGHQAPRAEELADIESFISRPARARAIIMAVPVLGDSLLEVAEVIIAYTHKTGRDHRALVYSSEQDCI
jgi:hypothetical protein